MSLNSILYTKFCFIAALTSMGNVRLCVRWRRLYSIHLGWGRRLWRTWLGLYLAEKNSLSSESSLTETYSKLIKTTYHTPSKLRDSEDLKTVIGSLAGLSLGHQERRGSVIQRPVKHFMQICRRRRGILLNISHIPYRLSWLPVGIPLPVHLNADTLWPHAQINV